MKYFRAWKYEFSSFDWKTILAGVIATGIIAPIVALATQKIIKKILKK